MHDWAALLGEWPDGIPLSNNVAPSAIVPVYTASGAYGMRWGLIPVWSMEINSKYSTFNARLETVDSKPAFKSAWIKSQRCLLPARGYYEWRLEEGSRQPYFVSLPAGMPMTMAGLFEPARDPELPASCTVITRPASGHMSRLHDRVPVILPVEKAADWFSAAPENALRVLSDDPERLLEFYPVSKHVNNPRNDDEALVEPIERSIAML